jgi:GH24 family phage-related lysozyme (muramidase)
MISQDVSDRALSLAVAFVADAEGCLLTAYHGAADRADVWTIGYGLITWQGKPVAPGLKITQAEAEQGLRDTLSIIAAKINAVAPDGATAGQLAALYSLAFNLGSGAILASTLVRLWRAGNVRAAADQFPDWCHSAGRVVLGLQLRRAAERAVFLFNN